MKRTLVLAISIFAASAICGFAADAKENWDQHCAKCHGADGKGATKMGEKLGVRDFTDAKVKATIVDADAFKALKEGLTKDGKQQMKPFSPLLTDDELNALVAFVHKL